jgi:hypothetical protein
MPYRTPPPGQPPWWYRLGMGFVTIVVLGCLAEFGVIGLVRFMSIAH